MAIPTHRVLVCELGEDKAEAQLLPWQGPVVVAVVVLLITQGEGLRQGLQLGSDVGLGNVFDLSPAPVNAGVHVRFQELHGRGRTSDQKCNDYFQRWVLRLLPKPSQWDSTSDNSLCCDFKADISGLYFQNSLNARIDRHIILIQSFCYVCHCTVFFTF